MNTTKFLKYVSSFFNMYERVNTKQETSDILLVKAARRVILDSSKIRMKNTIIERTIIWKTGYL